jgi:CheY-like chemotaxis protein
MFLCQHAKIALERTSFMSEEPPQATSTAPESRPVSLSLLKSFLRVLHVNDSTDDQVLFQAACRKGNVPFNWHVCDSANKAMSYLQSLVDQSKKTPVCWPDLVLLDIVMPGGSGIEVLKFVRRTPELRQLPVIIFTGHQSPDAREQAMALGANLWLIKPTDFNEIVEIAKNLYRLTGLTQSGTDN